MNVKYVFVLLAVFFLAISAVCAAENVTGDDAVVSAVDDLACEDVSVAGDSLATSSEEDAVASVDEEILTAPSEDASADDEPLAASSDDDSVASVNNEPVSLSAESQLSVSDNHPVVSVSVNQDNSKLTGIYDKVYSREDWRTVGWFTITYKYKWSKKKINKVTKKKLKSKKKRAKKVMKKYVKKGWHYYDIYYTVKYGKHSVRYKYYLQFYRTVYYNGYGKVLYVC